MFARPANTLEQLASSLVLLAYISWLRGQAVQLLTFQWVDMNVLFSQDSGLHIYFSLCLVIQNLFIISMILHFLKSSDAGCTIQTLMWSSTDASGQHWHTCAHIYKNTHYRQSEQR